MLEKWLHWHKDEWFLNKSYIEYFSPTSWSDTELDALA